MGTTGEIGHLCHKSADDFIYFDSFRNAQKYGMLCMESNGRIAPMARTVFSGDPGKSGAKKGVFFIFRTVSAGGCRQSSKEAAGATPWGFPDQSENE